MVSFLVLAFLAIWFGIQGESTNSVGIAGMMVGELGTVIGYYFGSKQSLGIDRMENGAEKDPEKQALLTT